MYKMMILILFLCMTTNINPSIYDDLNDDKKLKGNVKEMTKITYSTSNYKDDKYPLKVVIEYNENKLKISEKYYSKNILSSTFKYIYDNNNKLLKIENFDSNNQISSYTEIKYDKKGNLIEEKVLNLKKEIFSETIYTFNNHSQIIKIETKFSNVYSGSTGLKKQNKLQKVLSKRLINYDKTGNVFKFNFFTYLDNKLDNKDDIFLMPDGELKTMLMYDSENKLYMKSESEFVNEKKVAVYNYNKDGIMTSYVTNEYDNNNNLQIINYFSEDKILTNQLKYKYDDKNNIIETTYDTFGSNPKTQIENEFSYIYR